MKRITYPATVNQVTIIGNRAYVASWCSGNQDHVLFACPADTAPFEGDGINVTFEWAARGKDREDASADLACG